MKEGKKIAIITGSSSGLGTVYAKVIAKKYPELDELWLIARRMERLSAVSKSLEGVVSRPIQFDLADNNSYEAIGRLLKAEKPNIKILVNNAGTDKSGPFLQIGTDDISMMTDLNVKGLSMMDRLCIPWMSQGSIILHICSVSAFSPLPYQSVYCASKAYVRFLGRALHEEMRNKGINVCTMFPGSMDTELWIGKEGQSHLPFLDMDVITERSLRYAEHGRGTYTPGLMYKLYRLFAKILPEVIIGKVVGHYFSVSGRGEKQKGA